MGVTELINRLAHSIGNAAASPNVDARTREALYTIVAAADDGRVVWIAAPHYRAADGKKSGMLEVPLSRRDVFFEVRSRISMSSPISATCPHGLRPGTNVCLRCRYEERAADRKRRYMVVARVGIAAGGVVLAISVLIGAVMAIAPDASSSAPTEASEAGSVVQAAAPRSKAPARVAPRAVEPEPVAAATGGSGEPRIAARRPARSDSMFAVREGPEVTVHFDTESLRTRYDWKFERVVRSTLPIVFGSAVRAALDSIPEGRLASGGDLLTELTTRGIDLPIGEGQTLRVWPVTRPGQDGPLVVAYRAASAP
jgi:hypothetical protein